MMSLNNTLKKKREDMFCVNLPLMAISQHVAGAYKQKYVSNHTI
jgi:hypothetical protein